MSPAKLHRLTLFPWVFRLAQFSGNQIPLFVLIIWIWDTIWIVCCKILGPFQMTSVSVVNSHSSCFNYLVLFFQVSIAFLKITMVLFGSVSHGSAQWPVKYLVYHLPQLWEFAAWHFGSDQFVCSSRGFLGMKFINSPYCSTTILLPPLFLAQHSPGKYETLPLLHIFSDSVYVQNRRGRRNSNNAPPHFKATTISDQWGMCPSKIIQGLLFPQVLSWPPLTRLIRGKHVQVWAREDRWNFISP